MGAVSEKRRFITVQGVENAREIGVVTLGPRDVITDEATQRARDLGIEVFREPNKLVGGRRDDSAAAASGLLSSDKSQLSAATAGLGPKPSKEAPEQSASHSSQRMSTRHEAAAASGSFDASLREVVLAVLREELGDRVVGLEEVVDLVLARERPVTNM